MKTKLTVFMLTLLTVFAYAESEKTFQCRAGSDIQCEAADQKCRLWGKILLISKDEKIKNFEATFFQKAMMSVKIVMLQIIL